MGRGAVSGSFLTKWGTARVPPSQNSKRLTHSLGVSCPEAGSSGEGCWVSLQKSFPLLGPCFPICVLGITLQASLAGLSRGFSE